MSEDDVDDVEFCFWCPDCLEPAEVCMCSQSQQDDYEPEIERAKQERAGEWISL